MTFRHLGVRAASSASGSRGAARRPSIATALCRAHSRRLLVSAGGCGGLLLLGPPAVVAERRGDVERSVIC